jgi:zinc transport system substrate-binding protein
MQKADNQEVSTVKGKLLLSLALLLASVFFPWPTQASQGKPIRAFVSILPQDYFVSRVGGDQVKVKILVGPGQSHETYEPTPQQIAALARSDVYFTIGAPFERSLVPKVRAMLPGLGIVDTSTGVQFLSFAPGSGEHGIDPHIWLDPKQVKIIARNVCNGLKKIDPGRAGAYDANLAGFQTDLDTLDARIARILAPVRGRTIYVFHPAFQYFCKSYGLKQEAFESEGKEPSAKQMAKLIASAEREHVKAVFVQPQFSQKAARAIARSIGGRVVTLNPLPEDYIKDMSAMAVTIRDSLLGMEKAQGKHP